MMDVYDIYTYSSAAWLAIQGVPLTFYPHYVLSLARAATIEPQVPASDFTIYSFRALGVFFLAASLASLSITIIAPPSQIPSPNEPRTPLTTSASTAPPSLGSAILPLTMLVHAGTAMASYRQYMLLNSTTWFMEMVASGLMAGMGISALLFGDESRPGRGSRWPFESKEQREKRKGKWEGRKEKLKKGL